MFRLLELREKMKKIYQDNGVYCVALFKFLVSFVVFLVIGNRLNFNSMLSNILVTLVFSLIGAFAPWSVLVFMAACMAVMQVFYFSSAIGIAVALILVIIYCLSMRFAPKMSYATLAMAIMYSIKMPIMVPILLGLFGGLVSIVPIACGTIIYFVFNAVTIVASDGTGPNQVEASVELYNRFISILKGNGAIIFSIVAFCAILVIVYVVRTRMIAHAFELSILIGVIVYMIAFITGSLILGSDNTGVRVVLILVGAVLSFAVAYVVQIFRFVLDYSAIESVQFEDDDYVYYVRAVPKLNVEEEDNYIKKISIQKPKNKSNNDVNDEKNIEDKKNDDKGK